MHESENSTVSQRRGRKKIRRCLKKILFFMVGAGFLFSVALVVAVRIFFPPERLKDMAIVAAEKELGRRLSIGEVAFNPLKGFQFRDLHLTSISDSLDREYPLPVREAFIRSMSMRYSLRAVLRKHLVLKSFSIDHPRLVLFLNSELASRSDAKADTTAAVGLDQLVLPVRLDLRSIAVREGSFSIVVRDSLSDTRIQIDSISLFLRDVSIPRGPVISDSTLLRGKVHLLADQSRLNFEQDVRSPASQATRFRTLLQADIGLEIKGIDNVQTSVKIDLHESSFSYHDNATRMAQELSPVVGLELQATADLLDTLINVQQLAFTLDRHPWLQLKGRLAQVAEGTAVDVRVNESRIPFIGLYNLASDWIPGTRLIHWHNPKSEFTLKDSQVRGILINRHKEPDLTFQVRMASDDFGITINHGEQEVDRFRVIASADGRITSSGMADLHAAVQMGVDSLYVELPDDLLLTSGKISLQGETRLDSTQMPVKLALGMTARNLMQANLDVYVDLAGDHFQSLSGSANVGLKNIRPQVVPDLPLRTTLSADLEIDFNTLDKIKGALKVKSDSLFYVADKSLGFPPIALSTDFQARVDLSAQEARIDTLRLHLNNVLSAMLRVRVSPQDFQVNLDELAIEHQPLYRLIPREMREQLYDLRLSGSTHITAQAKGRQSDSPPSFQLKGRVHTANTRVDYPSQGLTLDGVHLDLDLESHSTGSTLLSTVLSIDDICLEFEKTLRYRNNRLSFGVQTQDGSTVHLRDGRLELPDLSASGHFAAILEQLSENIRFSGQVEFDQAIADTIYVADLLGMHGSQRFSLNFFGDTTKVDVKAFYTAEHLDLLLPGETIVRDLNARLVIEQGVDLLSSRLLAREATAILTPSDAALDYQVLRDYYRAVLKNRSTLSIASIEAAGYRISDVAGEMYLGEGWIEVPFLQASAYGGNLVGRIGLDLASGDLRHAVYTLSAHFTEVNSELFLPEEKNKDGRGIINGNLTLNGNGVDPEYGMMIGGYFYLTEIGPRVVLNLLRALDPQGTDTGIGLTQQLIGWGFKPSLMSFFIRHGYFYPAIHFAQPWYFPVRLSQGKVELSRVPVKFFLQTALRPPSQTMTR
ncbi:hypothetical protein JW992_08140 [candidate division KSB1 bacterium]|nr:hypothetical protein [candidate division KSB1 bacterium]